MIRCSWLPLGVVLLVTACEKGTPDPLPDAGEAPDALVPPAAPDEGPLATADFTTPPQAPRVGPATAAPPQQGPCPTGWTRSSLGSGVRCEPPASRTDCAPGERPELDGTCRRFGAECPSDGWPTDLPSGSPVLYVDPEAPPGGDGSLASPFDQLPVAVARAPANATLALRVGSHAGPVALDRAITLVGACASGTRLVADASEEEAVVRVAGAGAVLRELTITGPRLGVSVGRELQTVAGASLRAETVIVEGVVRRAISVWPGTRFEAQGLWVHDVAPRSSNGLGGHFVIAEDAVAQLFDAVLEDGARVGVLALGTAEVHLEDAAVRRVAFDADDVGTGILAADGPVRLTGARLLVEDTQEQALLAFADVRIELDQTTVRGVTPVLGVGGLVGAGLWLESGGHLTMRRGNVRDVALLGAVGFSPGTRLTFEDTWFGQIDHREPSSAALVGDGAELVAERLWIEDYLGLTARDPGSRVAARDLVLRAPPDVEPGEARATLVASEGGTVTATAVDAFGSGGVGVYGEASSGRVEGLRVRDTGPRAAPGGYVTRGTLTVIGAEVEDADFQAFGADSGGALTVTDALIRGTTIGVANNRGRQVSLRRARIERTTLAGLWQIGGAAELEDVEVFGFARAEDGATGLNFTEGAEATLRRVQVTDMIGDGLRVMQDARVDAEDLRIAGTSNLPVDFGLYVRATAAFEGRRVSITDYPVGVFADGDTQIDDLRVTGRPSADVNVGVGGRGDITLRRARVLSTRGIGLWAQSGELEAEDIVVEDTARSEGVAGFGAAVTEQGRLQLTRARIRSSGTAGVWAADDGQAILRDVVVAESVRPSCTDESCDVASGILVQDRGAVDLERFELLRHPTAGVHVLGEAGVDAREGVIGECGVGLLVEGGSFDLERVSERVWFRGNQRTRQDRDAAFPPIRVQPPATPDPEDPLGG